MPSSEFAGKGGTPPTRPRLWPEHSPAGGKVRITARKGAAWGEMYLPGLLDPEFRQEVFLEVACTVEPELLNSLARDIYPIFLAATGGKVGRMLDWRQHPTLHSILTAWADRWNLCSLSDSEWAIGCMVVAMRLGGLQEEPRELRYFPPVFEIEVPVLPIPPDFREYDPGVELRSEYLAQMEVQTRTRLSTLLPGTVGKVALQYTWDIWKRIEEYHLVPYCESVEAAYAQLGWLRANTRPSIYDHLRWLARWQVLGQSYQEIADAEGAFREAVQQALTGLPAALDLKPRPVKRGRPSLGGR